MSCRKLASLTEILTFSLVGVVLLRWFIITYWRWHPGRQYGCRVISSPGGGNGAQVVGNGVRVLPTDLSIRTLDGFHAWALDGHRCVRSLTFGIPRALWRTDCPGKRSRQHRHHLDLDPHCKKKHDWLPVMVYSYCPGTGPGTVQGLNGKYSTMWKCSHWSETWTGTGAHCFLLYQSWSRSCAVWLNHKT